MKLMNKDFLLGFLSCLCLILTLGQFNCGRTLSRLGFGDQKLDLPKDFKTMISVSLHKEADGNTTKDLTYETKDGNYRSVEYRDKPFQLEGSIFWQKQE
ncbi:MAG: hypothetical protein SFU98_00965 [Leptospiraceae bacterium]|nr:hypothetical protein [Leptospiraceae bacterium]